MFSFYQKYAKTIFDILIIVGTVYLVGFLFSLAFELTMPILVGFVIYLMIEPLARFLNKRGVKKALASSISIFLFLVFLVLVVITLGAVITSQIQQLSENIPTYVSFFQNQIVHYGDQIQEKIGNAPPELIEKGQEYINATSGKIADLLSILFASLFRLLTSIPTLLMNFVIGLVLAYFLSVEIDQWKTFAKEKTPQTFKKAFRFFRTHVLSGIAKYIKAQCKLISITFILVYIGLVILGVGNALAIAFLSAIFDLLPLLGIPVIFIPWIIYLLIVGNTKLAVGLLIVLAVTMITRQILEPKIAGNSLGVSAFTMLSFMVISMALFGVAGIIFSPILLILIKALHDEGYLKRWIRLPEDEFESK